MCVYMYMYTHTYIYLHVCIISYIYIFTHTCSPQHIRKQHHTQLLGRYTTKHWVPVTIRTTTANIGYELVTTKCFPT